METIESTVAAHLRAISDRIYHADPPLEGYGLRECDILSAAATIVERIGDAKPAEPLTGLAGLLSEAASAALRSGWEEE